jgi:hypothetical protein
MPVVHSDILVHWTGKDIERQWKNKAKGEDPAYTQAYIDRLRSILLNGLWMTKEKFIRPIGFTGRVEQTPCVCFTELKLSESEAHAKKYGRLGIGFKRPFVFNRGGRPMIYYWGSGKEWERDVYFKDFIEDFREKPEKHWRMHFFKPMNSKKGPKSRRRYLDYDFYSESEWRIVFHDELVKKSTNRVKDTRDPLELERDTVLAKYVQGLSDAQRKKLRYLVPLDGGWLAIIIYPSMDIKKAAQGDDEIQRRIQILALHNHVRKEYGNRAVELDLDLCSHL